MQNMRRCTRSENARTKVWKQTKYTCSQCQETQPPSHYDYKHLAILEEQEQVYLAVCISCKSEGNTGIPVKCVECSVQKTRNEFSFARRRCKHYTTWLCLECDFPPCKICKAKLDVRKQAPYICEPCSFPPCRCGAPRPRSTKYLSSNKM